MPNQKYEEQYKRNKMLYKMVATVTSSFCHIKESKWPLTWGLGAEISVQKARSTTNISHSLWLQCSMVCACGLSGWTQLCCEYDLTLVCWTAQSSGLVCVCVCVFF